MLLICSPSCSPSLNPSAPLALRAFLVLPYFLWDVKNRNLICIPEVLDRHFFHTWGIDHPSLKGKPIMKTVSLLLLLLLLLVVVQYLFPRAYGSFSEKHWSLNLGFCLFRPIGNMRLAFNKFQPLDRPRVAGWRIKCCFTCSGT